MKIKANIKYPPPKFAELAKFEARQLEFDEACKLVDALTTELLMTNKYITLLETMLEECQEHFAQRSDVVDGENGEPSPNTEMQLLIAIKEVLK